MNSSSHPLLRATRRDILRAGSIGLLGLGLRVWRRSARWRLLPIAPRRVRARRDRSSSSSMAARPATSTCGIPSPRRGSEIRGIFSHDQDQRAGHPHLRVAAADGEAHGQGGARPLGASRAQQPQRRDVLGHRGPALSGRQHAHQSQPHGPARRRARSSAGWRNAMASAAACRPTSSRRFPIATAKSTSRPASIGGCLGPRYDPFVLDDDPNAAGFKVRNFALDPSSTADRLQERLGLLARSLGDARRPSSRRWPRISMSSTQQAASHPAIRQSRRGLRSFQGARRRARTLWPA